MSNMKNLLGDMDFEEFEVKRKQVLDKAKELDAVDLIESDCEDVATFYDYWLEIGGKRLACKRVMEHHGGIITTIGEFNEYAQYLSTRFIGWLETF